MRIPWRLGVIALVSAALVAALGIRAASAATTGEFYNHQNPMVGVPENKTPCYLDARTPRPIVSVRRYLPVASSGVYDWVTIASLELRYSPTCRTAWGKVTNFFPSRYRVWLEVIRTQDDMRDDNSWISKGQYWTGMLNDAGFSSLAQAYIQDDDTTWSEWVETQAY